MRNELYEALCFARSVIKSGESWTDECEKVIGGALASHERQAADVGTTDKDSPLSLAVKKA